MFGSMAVLCAAFTSCSKEIAFDSEGLANQAAAQLKAEYRANFEKKYGAIAPNQTWDFSTMTPSVTLPSTGTATRAEGDEVTITFKGQSSMTINKSVNGWMHQNVPLGQDNTSVGSPFCAEATSTKNTFTIVPFYQGKASYTWELWVNVGGKDGKDQLIWTKNQDLTYIDAKGKHDLTNDGVPAGATQINAPTFTYEVTPGAKMYFYLKVWTEKDGTHYPNGKYVIKSSLKNYMRALEGLTRPTGNENDGYKIPADDFVTLVGCEDGGGDNDYEDLAFMFIGPRLQEVEVVEVREGKRYMMEDLGATDDFDFNDVVVDVANVYQNRITWRENDNHEMVKVREEEVSGSRKQEAIVRAAGGIYNFTLKIGDTEWVKGDKVNASQMINTGWGNTTIDPDYEIDRFTVTGWIPGENNISLLVPQKSGTNYTDVLQEIKFPKAGDAPMIIAVDDSQGWMKERQSIPGGTNSTDDWWYNPVNQ